MGKGNGNSDWVNGVGTKERGLRGGKGHNVSKTYRGGKDYNQEN